MISYDDLRLDTVNPDAICATVGGSGIISRRLTTATQLTSHLGFEVTIGKPKHFRFTTLASISIFVAKNRWGVFGNLNPKEIPRVVNFLDKCISKQLPANSNTIGHFASLVGKKRYIP
jgi:hypothetical protein